MGRMAGGAAPVGLGAGVGLRSTAEAAMATGEAAGVVARALPGVLVDARTVARLAAAW